MATELMPGRKRFTVGTVLADVAIVGWFVFSLFPIVWMVLLSLKTSADQTSTYFAFSPTLENFGTVLSAKGEALTSVNFSQALITSRSEEHTSELQSHVNLVCRLLLEKKKKKKYI